jgi:hypothetical protein
MCVCVCVCHANVLSCQKMAATVTKKGVSDEAPMHRIRITLSSRNVKSLEKGTLWGESLCIREEVCFVVVAF